MRPKKRTRYRPRPGLTDALWTFMQGIASLGVVVFAFKASENAGLAAVFLVLLIGMVKHQILYNLGMHAASSPHAATPKPDIAGERESKGTATSHTTTKE